MRFFGDSKLFIQGGFQTLQSKANNMNWDDEGDEPPFKEPGTGMLDEEAPF